MDAQRKIQPAIIVHVQPVGSKTRAAGKLGPAEALSLLISREVRGLIRPCLHGCAGMEQVLIPVVVVVAPREGAAVKLAEVEVRGRKVCLVLVAKNLAVTRREPATR